jgi:transcriptional regulator with XRE-family HTH domain
MTKDETSAHCRELGILLRTLREEADLQAREVAAGINWTTVKISRVEHGKQKITVVDAATYALFCGATGQRLADVLDLAGEVDTGHRFKPHHGEVPDRLRSLMIEESTAAHITDYEVTFIPGLAQTEEYSRALISERSTWSPEALEACVQARMARQGLIKKVDPTQCAFVIHETALRMFVGSAAIMHEQALHLLFLDSRPQCDIRVVPTKAGHHGVATTAFRIMEYYDRTPMVYVPTLTGSVFFEKQPDVDDYRAQLKRIDAVALDSVQSRDLLMRIAGEYEVMGDGKDEHA